MAKTDPIPDWLLERVAVDEVPARLRGEVARRMDPDTEEGTRNRARLAGLKDSNREILDALPVDQAVQEIERRRRMAAAAASAQAQQLARRPARWWMPLGGALAAGVALAALALVVLPNRGAPDSPDSPFAVHPDGETVRLKGDPFLVLHRKRGDQVSKLEQRSVARAGDRIQISYVAADHEHGVILSIDGAGVVTLHHPASPTSSTALEAKGPVSLQSSYELDDAPDFERFFFVTARQPLDPLTIIEQAESLARHASRDPRRVRSRDLDLERAFDSRRDPQIRQWSFLLDKTDQENNP